MEPRSLASATRGRARVLVRALLLLLLQTVLLLSPHPALAAAAAASDPPTRTKPPLQPNTFQIRHEPTQLCLARLENAVQWRNVAVAAPSVSWVPCDVHVVDQPSVHSTVWTTGHFALSDPEMASFAGVLTSPELDTSVCALTRDPMTLHAAGSSLLASQAPSDCHRPLQLSCPQSLSKCSLSISTTFDAYFQAEDGAYLLVPPPTRASRADPRAIRSAVVTDVAADAADAYRVFAVAAAVFDGPSLPGPPAPTRAPGEPRLLRAHYFADVDDGREACVLPRAPRRDQASSVDELLDFGAAFRLERGYSRELRMRDWAKPGRGSDGGHTRASDLCVAWNWQSVLELDFAAPPPTNASAAIVFRKGCGARALAQELWVAVRLADGRVGLQPAAQAAVSADRRLCLDAKLRAYALLPAAACLTPVTLGWSDAESRVVLQHQTLVGELFADKRHMRLEEGLPAYFQSVRVTGEAAHVAPSASVGLLGACSAVDGAAGRAADVAVDHAQPIPGDQERLVDRRSEQPSSSRGSPTESEGSADPVTFGTVVTSAWFWVLVLGLVAAVSCAAMMQHKVNEKKRQRELEEAGVYAAELTGDDDAALLMPEDPVSVGSRGWTATSDEFARRESASFGSIPQDGDDDELAVVV